MHSWTSSAHVGPLKPMGQAHLKRDPFAIAEHVPPFSHGDDEQRFAFSQFLPAWWVYCCNRSSGISGFGRTKEEEKERRQERKKVNIWVEKCQILLSAQKSARAAKTHHNILLDICTRTLAATWEHICHCCGMAMRCTPSPRRSRRDSPRIRWDICTESSPVHSGWRHHTCHRFDSVARVDRDLDARRTHRQTSKGIWMVRLGEIWKMDSNCKPRLTVCLTCNMSFQFHLIYIFHYFYRARICKTENLFFFHRVLCYSIICFCIVEHTKSWFELAAMEVRRWNWRREEKKESSK